MKKIVSLSAIFFSFLAIFSQSSIRINEIMQSNIDCLYLEHDYPDSWIELYNNSEQDIDLFHYYIGNDSNISSAFRIETHDIIKAKDYIIVQCDKKNKNLHTDFKLESTETGTICILDSVGTICDKIDYPAMVAANIAYGRRNELENDWGWEIIATPNKQNTGTLCDFLLPAPCFSTQGQVLQEQIHLSISMPDVNLPEDTRIYYTLDGKEPTLESISDTIIELDIDKTVVVRAKLISTEALSPRSTTHSYIFHPRKTELPIISIVTDNSYLYGSKEGIFSASKTEGGVANYYQNWRRPMNVEYLGSKDDEISFNQVGEMSVGGDRTRNHTHKTMRLYANKRFGTKRYYGTFWKEKPHVTKVKSFSLRNGGQNDGMAMINDGLVQRIFGTHIPTLDYVAYQPSIAYINGVYKGLYGLRERSNQDYVEANYGLDNVEIATNDSYIPTSNERYQTSFSKLYNLYRKSTTTYQQLAELMDVNSFMQAMIAEMFTENYDFPQKNVAMWREKTATGKWHWILKDLDHFAMTSDTRIDFNMFKYLLGTAKSTDYEYTYTKQANYKEAIKIYQKMMTFEEFKEPFIDAFTTYLGDFLKPSVTSNIYQQLKDAVDPEIEPTFEVYDYDYEDYDYYTNRLKNHCENRASIIYGQMATYFKLGSVIPMTLQTNGCPIKINEIGLTEGDFDGAYYSKRVLRLDSGRKNKGWSMTLFQHDENNEMIVVTDTLFSTPTISILLEDYNTCDSVSFSTYTFAESDFELKIKELAIEESTKTDWSEDYNISFVEPKIAYVNITCDSLPNSKYDDLHASLDYYDENGNYMKKKILLNLQGNSQPKKNFSIAFCEDDWLGDITTKITIGDWVTQDEFHLKAFYNDGIRGTAEIAYELYGQITQRDMCYPKAIPAALYINGDFYGIMAWQLKKHRANMGLDKKESTNVWLDGTLNDKQIFKDTINWTKFEVRNPKDLYTMDGSEYDGDDPQELIDSSSPFFINKGKMVRTEEAKKHIIDLSHYYSELSNIEKDNNNESLMRTEIAKRFDVSEIINYMVFSLITNNYDGFSKNWQWFTQDGQKWSVAPYDCNLTFGYNEEGIELWPASQSSKKYDYRMENADTNGPMYWIRKYFWNDVKTRYAELRNNGTISTDNIISLTEQWINRIGEDNYEKEWNLWSDSPIKLGINEDISRIENWVSERINLNDVYLGYITKTIEYELSFEHSNWATICVPFVFDIPNDVEVYTVGDINQDSLLELEIETVVYANKPYLLYGNLNSSYLLSGIQTIGSSSEDGYLKNGLLIGTLEDSFVPKSVYVLQNNENITAFYYVAEDNLIAIKGNHAYLMPTTGSKKSYYHLPSNNDNIPSITFNQTNKETFYNGYGQKIEKLKAGLNIIKTDSTGKSEIILIK